MWREMQENPPTAVQRYLQKTWGVALGSAFPLLHTSGRVADTYFIIVVAEFPPARTPLCSPRAVCGEFDLHLC